jgi:hypothetical protein
VRDKGLFPITIYFEEFIIMITLEEVVQATIGDFILHNVLFTALDVSNKVKEELPMARHRDVRDLVRALFTSVIDPASYAKTPIEVTLDDGNKVEALLYHPLVDSWDLDTKYNDQKRAQRAARPGQNLPVAPAVATIANDGTITVNASSTVVTPVAPIPSTINTRDLWSNMFQAQPSLFPRKNQ